MRVGIFPGAFDPIHKGHIAFAQAAIKQFGLDKIFFLVEPRPRRKQGVRALEHRVAMVQAAITDEPKLGVIVLEEARFAIDSTWPKIKARMGTAEIYMLMGESSLNHIVTWPQINELVEAAPSFIIGTRRDNTKQDLQEKLYTLQHTKAFPFVYHLTAMPEPKINSRAIRASLRRGQAPNISAAVAAYAAYNNLYASGNTEK